MPKLVALDVEETSGVDYPAHLDDGWLVLKARGTDATTELAALTKETTLPEAPEATEAAPEVEKADEMTPEAAAERIAELEAELAEAQAKLAEKATEEEPAEEPSVEDLVKSVPEPVAKALDDMRTRMEKAEGELAERREAQALTEAVGFVKSLDKLTLGDDVAPLIKSARQTAPDLAKAIEGLLVALNAQTDTAALFTEVGKAGTPATGSPEDKLAALAKAKAEKSDISFHKAYAAVLKSDEGKALYAEIETASA